MLISCLRYYYKLVIMTAVAQPGFGGRGIMASVEREPIWGSGALPPVGSRSKASDQGVRGEAPEADDILLLGYKFSALRMHLRHTYTGI
jgi:hypothetical protein